MAGTPEWLRTVRAHRPAHAVNVLGPRSELLLLSAGDLRREAGGPLVRAEVPAAVMLPALLRAVRQVGGIVGLVKPGAVRGVGPAPLAFAQGVFRAAESVAYANPFFLASPPLGLEPTDDHGERLRAEIQRYLDAGFTEVVVHAEGWEPTDAAGALQTAVEPARDREVALALWSATEQGAKDLHGALAGHGVSVDLVAVGSRVEPGDVSALTEALRPARLELALGGEATADLGGLEVSAVLRDLAQALWGREAGPESYAAAEGLSADQQERVEALLYADLLAALPIALLRGTSARALQGLSVRREG